MRVPFTGPIMIAWPPPIDDLSTPGGEALTWLKAISQSITVGGISSSYLLPEFPPPARRPDRSYDGSTTEVQRTQSAAHNRLLQPHSKIDEVDQHLNMSLGLNAATQMAHINLPDGYEPNDTNSWLSLKTLPE
jgi:hypothetical protein